MSTQVKISPHLEKLLSLTENKEILAACLKTMAGLYRSMMQKRYKIYASGGGDWKPLSPVTIAKRRKCKGKGSDKILIDTSGLIHAVGSMTHVGAMNTINGSYITLGFSSYPHKGGDTYNNIAGLHQNGGWTVIDGARVYVPQRKILVPPNAQQNQKLAQSVERAIQEYIQ